MTDLENLFGTLFSATNKLQAFGDSYMETVTSKQWFLLACIAIMDSPKTTLTNLVPVVGSSRQNIKQLALKLERKGLLKIETDPGDSRALSLSLTPSCRKFLSARAAKDRAMLESLFGGIPAGDIEVTLRTLKRVETNMPRTRRNERENEDESGNE